MMLVVQIPFRTGVIPLADPQATLASLPGHDDTPKLKLHAWPGEVRRARRWATATMAGLVPGEHCDDVELVVSELVANALAAAARYSDVMLFGYSFDDTPVHLSLLTTQRWTRIEVRDPETYLRPAAPHDVMDESGRGLDIVGALGQWGHIVESHYKIVYAVLPIVEGPVTR